VQTKLPAATSKTVTHRAVPSHAVVKRKHPAAHRPTLGPSALPKPVGARPKPQAPAIRAQQRGSRPRSWVNIAIVAGLGLLLVPAVMAATLRILHSTRRGKVVSDVDLASAADPRPVHAELLPPTRLAPPLPSVEASSTVGLDSSNGSRADQNDWEIPTTRRVLRPTPQVEIATEVALPSLNGSAASLHDEELEPLESVGHLPLRTRPPIPAAESRCAITWWRGYVRSQFLAVAEGGTIVVAESPSFRWRSSKPPSQTEEAAAAHQQLMSALRDLGWEAGESGAVWYEVEFHREPVGSVST
jgi:hypothetical protein